MESKQSGSKDFDRTIQDGEELFRSGNLDEARKVFEELARLDPLNPEVLNNLGTVLYHKGDIHAAEQNFLKAFELDGSYLEAIFNLADLHFNSKKWDKAAHFLELYLSNSPPDKEDLNKLAIAYMESGFLQKAVEALKKSLDVDPAQDEIREMLGALNQSLRSMPRGSTPLVAVGLPVYNGERYIAQAIESILHQDFLDLELIISDNNSTDRTGEICLSYQRRDKRIKYHRFNENMGMQINFLSVLGRCTSEFFMFTTHDDLREKTYVKNCLDILLDDASVALAHSRSKMLDRDSRFMGIAQDQLHAGQESPKERFRQVIWQIGMCNAFLGIFRFSVLKKLTSWGKSLFADNLLLAETALLGKIIQIEESLFIRRLTRNYNYNSHEERNTQLMSEINPKLFSEGISFPHCRLAYGHLEIVNQSALDSSEKSDLIKEVKQCFRSRFDQNMSYEIDRAIALINRGCYYHEWNKSMFEVSNRFPELKSFHISALLKALEEARFFYPERQDLVAAIGKCQAELLS